MSRYPMFLAIMPVSKAANKGGSVVVICSSSPVAQAIATTTAGLNHLPFQLHSSPKAHHRTAHDANPLLQEKLINKS